MNRLENIKNNIGKYTNIIGIFFSSFIVSLIESYGWRGFLLRVVFVIILFKLSTAGMPEYNMSTSGGKMWIVSGGLFIYAVGKFVYDYTKAGKESEAKKRNKARLNKKL